MAQPQHQQLPLPAAPPPRPFSPAQLSPALPNSSQAPYSGNPPPKRQRTSPGPASSQPGSPYVASPSYMQSPGGMATPPPMPSAPSPAPYPSHIALPPSNLAQQPYVNGNAHNNGLPLNHSMQAVPAGLTMPGRTPGTPPVASPAPLLPVPSPATTPLTPVPAASPYATTNAILAPLPQTPAPAGVMGPPSKPAERPVKEVQYDVDDSLAGTGIDLREEEQFMAQFYAGSTRPEARTGFPANTPGGAASMYGAGLANQPAEAVSQDQTQFQVEQAKATWQDAAGKLAVVRSAEVRNPFSNVAVLHRRAQQIAKEYGLGLVLDPKNNSGMGKMKMDSEFPEPSVEVTTTVLGPDAVVSTTKSFLPVESFLAEQIGLLSIATKHRLRQLVEDADRVARTRQQTSHGVAPPEWADVAVPIKSVDASLLETASPAPGDESAADPGANPLKRSLGTGVSDPAAATSGKPAAAVNGPGTGFSMTAALRESSKAERDAEEARLRKRQKRAEDEERKKKGGDPTASVAGSRAGSVAPGTPGGADADAAPAVKAPTKKELKAKAAAAQKSLDSMNTATANSTTQHFLDSLSRKKKGKRTYSWMGAGAGSGASTPRGSAGPPGTPGAVAAGAAAALGRNRAPEVTALTQDGRYRHGEFRETGEKGKNIQLRDWIQVLEREQHLEFRALQKAYLMLDSSASN